MQVTKTYEGYGRMGYDKERMGAFFNYSPTRSDFAHLILDALEGESQKIHSLTCHIKQFDVKSRTGTYYLAEKCIKYKIKIEVEAELVDDEDVGIDVK